jgi:branched-subunit amino acid transport protein
MYLFGDLNCNMLDSSSHATKRLTSLMETYQLSEMISQPTRLTQTTASLLDVCIISNSENVVSADVVSLCIRDHNLIYVVRRAGPKAGPIPIRVLKFAILSILIAIIFTMIFIINHGTTSIRNQTLIVSGLFGNLFFWRFLTNTLR